MQDNNDPRQQKKKKKFRITHQQILLKKLVDRKTLELFPEMISHFLNKFSFEKTSISTRVYAFNFHHMEASGFWGLLKHPDDDD